MSFRTNSTAVTNILTTYLLEEGKIKSSLLPASGGGGDVDLEDYYTKIEADTTFAEIEHAHVAADITDFEAEVELIVAAALAEVPPATSDTSIAKAVRVVTDDATVTDADHIVIVNKTVAGATAITLLAAPVTGKMIMIKDGKGDANTNAITITGTQTIDGQSSIQINVAYEAVTLVYNGTQWNII